MKRFSRLSLVVAVVFLALIPAASAASGVVGASLDRGLDLIDRAYLFDSKLDPPELLDAALEYLEVKYPEVISRRSSEKTFLVEAEPCRLRIELPPEIDTVGELAPWLERTTRIISRCTAKPKKDALPLESVLLRAVLSGLDRYSTVFDAERCTEHSIQSVSYTYLPPHETGSNIVCLLLLEKKKRKKKKRITNTTIRNKNKKERYTIHRYKNTREINS